MGLLVSIIIPVYNVAPYIRESLDSVISQTYRNIEIIIVDDGSTDASGTICDEYLCDPRVRVIHQENRGLSGARNAGLNQASGEYVAFLDPDDAFHPEMIAEMLDAISRHDADLAVCGFYVYRTEGCMTDTRRVNSVHAANEMVLSAQEAFSALYSGSFVVSAWNKLYRRDLWKKLRYPEGKVYEDLLVIPYILEQCERIAVLPLCLVNYRERSGSITHTPNIRNVTDRFAAYRALEDYAEQKQPAVSPECVRDIRDYTLRRTIMCWAELRKQHAPTEVLEAFAEEIRKRAEKGIRFRKIWSRGAWMLYRYCPGLLLPARACFQGLKRLAGFDRGVTA